MVALCIIKLEKYILKLTESHSGAQQTKQFRFAVRVKPDKPYYTRC